MSVRTTAPLLLAQLKESARMSAMAICVRFTVSKNNQSVLVDQISISLFRHLTSDTEAVQRGVLQNVPTSGNELCREDDCTDSL